MFAHNSMESIHLNASDLICADFRYPRHVFQGSPRLSLRLFPGFTTYPKNLMVDRWQNPRSTKRFLTNLNIIVRCRLRVHASGSRHLSVKLVVAMFQSCATCMTDTTTISTPAHDGLRLFTCLPVWPGVNLKMRR